MALLMINDSLGPAEWEKASQRRGHFVSALTKPGAHPAQGVLVKGRWTKGLGWGPTVGPWAGAARAWASPLPPCLQWSLG